MDIIVGEDFELEEKKKVVFEQMSYLGSFSQFVWWQQPESCRKADLRADVLNLLSGKSQNADEDDCE